jgi:hypothetical protein
MFRNIAKLISITLLIGPQTFAQQSAPPEIACTIRESGQSLNCIWAGKEKVAMSSNDVQAFVDQSAVYSYITVKSRKGMERTFHPDSNSASFKKLADVKKTGSISEVSRAKLDLFAEIEKKVIQISEELDAQALRADLIKYDSSLTLEKAKLEIRELNKELDGFRGSKDKLCTSTPQFESLSKTNATLQTTLSNILVSFQSTGSCMDGFKIFKDKDGSVDLRQLDGVGKSFIENCKKK